MIHVIQVCLSTLNQQAQLQNVCFEGVDGFQEMYILCWTSHGQSMQTNTCLTTEATVITLIRKVRQLKTHFL